MSKHALVICDPMQWAMFVDGCATVDDEAAWSKNRRDVFAIWSKNHREEFIITTK